ncbi:GNAT family N-acetyltransferase [Sinorhizobium americanum]|uniref:N-acetyltransferase GCN5 n=1 Tax=Sinorhizobium americanum TaxID=194963 RepID=A0A1L3LNK4_9HYPH|nr:GNAT family N-acetyltransferase [Sinorhizobium americanum]APG85032.1 N-acetyltransferase GCN5 [Sinorhizobium americanum CCGM7]APG91677.1 N-acetyltransferase GCN5 [Sinorhizobium americanum]OAP47603.1 GNAT family acetyltransferase [Sinorhizobium americanum]
MIIRKTERLIIRNWREGDRDLFAEINNDPKVMEFFPFRRDRAAADALFDRNASTIAETGFGFFALALRDGDVPIGFCGLSRTHLAPHLPGGTIEIGWRLAVSYWRKGYATEAALALLDHGFGERNLGEIVSFAVATNARSIAVMRRIGMRPDPSRDFDHPGVPDTHQPLKRHVLYTITADEWRLGAKTPN